MELMYIWARMINGQKKQEFSFNFSRTHEVTYLEGKGKIIGKEKSNYNIFNDGSKGINQVYGLVGKNGCGKTTFLRSLIQRRPRNNSDLEIVYLFKSEEKYIIERETSGGIDILEYSIRKMYRSVAGYSPGREKNFDLDFNKSNFQKNFYYSDGKRMKFPDEKKQFFQNMIYYTPSLGNYLFQNDRVYKGSDLSYENKFSRVESEGLFRENWDEDLRNIYKMFGRIKNSEKLDNINKILKKEEMKKEEMKIKEVKTELFQVYFHGVSDNKNIISNEYFVKMKELNFGEYVPEILGVGEELRNSLIDYYKTLICLILVPEHKNEELLEYISFGKIEAAIKDIEINKMAKSQSSTQLKERIVLFNSYEADVKLMCKEFTKNVAPKMIDKKEENCYRINRDQISDSDELLEKIIEMSSAGFIGINTGFSDGQWNLLKLLGNIYNHIGKYLHEKDEILILLDEGDMGFHPEWQREYIDILVKFFNEVWGEEKRINLILASHSPFIASDLPTENVIFLGSKDEVAKAKGMKTFGANIHELYQSSFFMDSTMGEFAMKKIRGVIEDLTILGGLQRSREERGKRFEELEQRTEDLTDEEKSEKGKLKEAKKKEKEIEDRQEKIKYIIDNVGERVLSRKMREKYIEVFGETEKEKKSRIEKIYNSLSNDEKKILEEKFGGK